MGFNQVNVEMLSPCVGIYNERVEFQNNGFKKVLRNNEEHHELLAFSIPKAVY